MIDEVLIASLGKADEEAQDLIRSALGEEVAEGDMDPLLQTVGQDLQSDTIMTGRVVGFAGDDVVIDVGLKSEGLIPKGEFEDFGAVKLGQEFQVLLESLEGDGGLIQLSKRKADRIINWNRIVETTKEGDIVQGNVMRKIKGGLLVDIGVPVFLPASQVDIRRPGDIGEYIGRDIRAEVLKIDESRRNIVISRRKLIETEREEAKKRLLSSITEGDLVTGTVPGSIHRNLVDATGLGISELHRPRSWNHLFQQQRIEWGVRFTPKAIRSGERSVERIGFGVVQAFPIQIEQLQALQGTRILR